MGESFTVFKVFHSTANHLNRKSFPHGCFPVYCTVLSLSTSSKLTVTDALTQPHTLPLIPHSFQCIITVNRFFIIIVWVHSDLLMWMKSQQMTSPAVWIVLTNLF